MRSGVYTSGLIAVTATGEEIYLYNTSLPQPMLMSEVLSRNRPTLIDAYIMALCNARGRRQIVDIESHFPDAVSWVLDRYGRYGPMTMTTSPASVVITRIRAWCIIRRIHCPSGKY